MCAFFVQNFDAKNYKANMLPEKAVPFVFVGKRKMLMKLIPGEIIPRIM